MDVHQHDLVALTIDGLERLDPACYHVGGEPELSKQPEGKLRVQRVVLGDEETAGRRGRVAAVGNSASSFAGSSGFSGRRARVATSAS
jgi:hypothetical protein